MTLIPENTHPSWFAFLNPQTTALLKHIEGNIEGDVNPEKQNILRFLTNDLNDRKVVILGQDPYPEKGVATGRAFEIGTLKSWVRPFRQVSLKNIVRLIYKAYQGINHYGEIPAFQAIVRAIEHGDFHLKGPDKLFKSWEEQGVLLLNIWLSVKPSEPGSHRHLWNPFSEKLLSYISSQRPDLIWFLWGKNAIEKKSWIKEGNFFECRHPMMCSESYSDDFLKSNCIQETMHLVDWTGK